MSEHTRIIIGSILLLSCILLCTVPLFSAKSNNLFIYSSLNHETPTVSLTETEDKGYVLINGADKEELTELPGIGDTIAEMLILERTINGPFYYAEDLEAVKGIGLQTLAKIRSMIDLSPVEREE